MAGPLYRLLRPALFALSPEQSHRLAGAALQIAAAVPGVRGIVRGALTFHHPALRMECFGRTFPNPVGLAAGWDKDAAYIAGMPLLGLGFTEVGTVTPRPQPGNPPPRLFRVKERRALINRMGFNNAGAAAMAEQLRTARMRGLTDLPVGVNIGKNRDTSLLQAAADYVACVETLQEWADYLVVNVSSPNTPGLRDLQAPDVLEALLVEVVGRARVLRDRSGDLPLPVLVKVSPDVSDEALEGIVRAARRAGAAGFVAANTTRSREGLADRWRTEEGGLSGPPLKERSTEVIRRLYGLSDGAMPIIGVGGVSNAVDAYAKIRAGASLVQVYTGLIYEGPGLASRICRGLLRRLEADGFAHLREAVGADHGMMKG